MDTNPDDALRAKLRWTIDKVVKTDSNPDELVEVLIETIKEISRQSAETAIKAYQQGFRYRIREQGESGELDL